MVVQPQSRAQHPARAQVRLPGQDETQRMDQVRGLPAYRLTLTQRFAHQAELALFEVAQAAMDQLAAGTGGVCGQVMLLAEQDAQAAAAGVTGDAGAVDAATDDQQVEVVHRVSASCVCVESTVSRLYRTR